MISRPTGTPSIRRSSRSPKFVSTSAPTVQPPGIVRDDVPTPPLKSMHCVPVPAPTQPSATSPGAAASSAANTSSSESGKLVTSLRYESSHSHTNGMSPPSWVVVSCRSVRHLTVASYARPIASELVITIGECSSPHSAIWLVPISSPKPFSTWVPA